MIHPWTKRCPAIFHSQTDAQFVKQSVWSSNTSQESDQKCLHQNTVTFFTRFRPHNNHSRGRRSPKRSEKTKKISPPLRVIIWKHVFNTTELCRVWRGVLPYCSISVASTRQDLLSVYLSHGKVESLVSPDKTENGLYFNDIAAFWMPRVGLRCGEVLRFVRKSQCLNGRKRKNNRRRRYLFASEYFRSKKWKIQSCF